MEKTLQRLETHLIGEAPKPATPPPRKGIIRLSVSSQSLSRGASLAQVTTAFFVDDYRAGIALDSKSPSWDEMDKQEKRSIRNRFYTYKRAVKLVLFHADSYPLMPDDPTRYKEVVKRIATSACERLQAELGETKVITPGRLEKLLAKEEHKKVEKNGRLPGNTPEDAQTFFNSD